MKKNDKIYVAGHAGLVGSAIVRELRQEGYSNIVVRTHSELDLLDQRAVQSFFRAEQPQWVFLAAAKVGGIMANCTFPAEFIYNNIMMEANIIQASYDAAAAGLLFLGSTCIYPQMAPQPLKEEYLLTGPLEPTNQPYAVAKIAGIEMCRAFNRQYQTKFTAVMPTNLYGPNDNFDLETSHVLPALIRKFYEAKSRGEDKVVVWGSGKPVREFLYVDDLANACVFLMQNHIQHDLVNIGTGWGITIRDLAGMIKDVVGFSGDMVFDLSKPDGTPVKITDTSRLNSLGWKAKTSLAEGLALTYEWYSNNTK
ncbi:MAG TPA: GDP-L-fucose synthase [Methylomusa anaerophila]|uniref:GDP-L-fucose synthase n=1 Tax=Methylomusa anaerophila TaxID=1930071 RepID=A0A348AKG1_9FIRM|nr:GDP-L-fucose synthase [Methylomusa anaerophila]BBB91559.1 GDP-L-fucose synthase [Methylomusa anaerophila]HML89503.1 GDP-L-fucose synthase [Methylomusa anaerophila]